MTADFQSAIRNAEGALSVARDNLKTYEDKFKQWRDEVRICKTVLDRLREVAGVPLDAPILRPVPEPQPPLPGPTIAETLKQEVAAPAAKNFPAEAGANGFDRLAARRLCREWHIAYPVRKSYLASATQFKRQALKHTLTTHPDYQQWLDDGHLHIMSGNGVTFPVLHNCAKVLGVNAHAVEVAADKLFLDINVYGVEGVDYVKVSA